MANQDRSRQQSGEAPQQARGMQQGGAQQGAWEPGGSRSQAQRGAGAMQRSERDIGREGWRRDMPAQRGQYDPSGYGGGGPFAMMRRISDEFDRIFESFGMGSMGGAGFPDPWRQRGGGGGGGDLRTLWAPHIEMCRRGDKLVVQADLPGVRKEDVDIQVEDDRIVIQGERNEERTEEDEGVVFTERSYGSFHRVIPLPEGVNADEAKATFRDGVLQIELPAPQERQRGRKLSIEDASQGKTQGAGRARSGDEGPGTQSGG